jgi:hypothetical protein
MSGLAEGPRLAPTEWRGVALTTLAAVALFVVVRELPTGTNLSHMDFRVQGGNVIEFCDPANPQFLPVVAVRSPVTLTLRPDAPPEKGRDVRATLVLTTFSGKPIAPEDLQVVQTRRIHLMIVDPSLDDYQHVHPEPGRRPGEWTFGFRPRFGGEYRVFADFTPVATNRGLYAEATLEVAGPANPVQPGTQAVASAVQADGCRFSLATAGGPIRAGVPSDLTLSIGRSDGSPVPLQPVMGAFAHLVAFDAARTGFAHIHPTEANPLRAPDSRRPVFTFKLTIPSAGRYVVWSQVDLDGRETFVPFWFDVRPD